MPEPKYHEVLPITRKKAEAAFLKGNSREVIDALLSLAYHDPDWKYVQDKSIQFITHPNSDVHRIATECLGLVALFKKQLEVEKVEPILKKLLTDPDLSDDAEDSLHYIRIMPKPKAQARQRLSK